MWSSFWLQTNSTSMVGNGGEDGNEIDIFESNFSTKRTCIANNVIYDGYGAPTMSIGAIRDVGVDTYEGYHTNALKWTPTEYVSILMEYLHWQLTMVVCAKCQHS